MKHLETKEIIENYRNTLIQTDFRKCIKQLNEVRLSWYESSLLLNDVSRI